MIAERHMVTALNPMNHRRPPDYDPHVTTRTFRITIRGVFADLTADQRAQLLAEAADHDILHSYAEPQRAGDRTLTRPRTLLAVRAPVRDSFLARRALVG